MYLSQMERKHIKWGLYQIPNEANDELLLALPAECRWGIVAGVTQKQQYQKAPLHCGWGPHGSYILESHIQLTFHLMHTPLLRSHPAAMEGDKRQEDLGFQMRALWAHLVQRINNSIAIPVGISITVLLYLLGCHDYRAKAVSTSRCQVDNHAMT